MQMPACSIFSLGQTSHGRIVKSKVIHLKASDKFICKVLQILLNVPQEMFLDLPSQQQFIKGRKHTLANLEIIILKEKKKNYYPYALI